MKTLGLFAFVVTLALCQMATAEPREGGFFGLLNPFADKEPLGERLLEDVDPFFNQHRQGGQQQQGHEQHGHQEYGHRRPRPPHGRPPRPGPGPKPPKPGRPSRPPRPSPTPENPETTSENPSTDGN